MRKFQVIAKNDEGDRFLVFKFATYRHEAAKTKDATRFRQLASDPLPEWAADVKYEEGHL